MTPIDLQRIGELGGAIKLPGAPTSPTPAAGEKGAFGNILADSLTQVNRLQHAADTAIQDMATGGPASLHDTMIALEKAETSFKLMMQVRNKIVDAYHEVLRMQV